MRGGPVKVVVKLYAGHRKLVGSDTVLLTANPGTTIGHLIEMLIERHPPLAEVLGFSTIAVNHRQVSHDTILHEGDEVSLFPHIGGG